MDERAALLRAILEQPEDDTVRLVYADWLEEHDEAERGEFIRLQCRIALMRPTEMVREKTGRVLAAAGGPTLFVSRCRCRPCSLARREYEVSKRHIVWDWCGGVDGGWAHMVRGWLRGFVWKVAGTQADFLKHARDIFAAHPVVSVTLSDREPEEHQPPEGEPNWSWYSEGFEDDRATLPNCLFDMLGDPPLLSLIPFRCAYPSRDLALSALSAACVAFGRAAVSLPPLPAAQESVHR